jgi:hypothetical protein
MVDMRWRRFLSVVLAVLAMSRACTFLSASETEVENNDQNWSADSNGLRARLHLSYSHVFNGTGIIVSHLELQTISNIDNPMLVKIDGKSMKFRITDEEGQDVSMFSVPYSGRVFGTPELVLPFDSSIRFRIGPCGRGVPGDQAAQVDLGVNFGWALPHDKKQYYLHAVLEMEKMKKDRTELGHRKWHGHLELPPVRVPTEPSSRDPNTLGPLIERLGARMLSGNGSESESAVRKLSLIDDPRVIPWYVKAVQTDSYNLKFSALDRLCRLEGDDALAGLMIGVATLGGDMRNTTKPELANSLAKNIRHKAVAGLACSPHPKAKKLLFSMHEDPARSVRLTVLQTAARMNTPESLALLKSHVQDSDATVRREVDRLIQLRNQDE